MTDGLRFDPLAARTEIRDAIAAHEPPELGRTPNVFGDGTKVLGLVEEELQAQQDRWRLPQAWVSDVTGTGQRIHLASAMTYTEEPWTARPWVWPVDATVTINGTEIAIDRSKVEQVGWTQLGQRITVSLDVVGAPVTQAPTDTVSVLIPDATWMVGYLDGTKHVRLDHLDGSTYFHYVMGPGGGWVEVAPTPLVDAEVWGDRVPDARAAWVGFGEMSSSLELRYMTGRGSRAPISGVLTIDVEVGSGAHQAAPEEADAVAYRIMDQVIDVLAHLPRLADGSRVEVTGHRTLQSWRTHEDRESILALQVTVESK